MIVKKVPNPRKSASKAVRVTNLSDYIVQPGRGSATEKCIHCGERGFVLAEDHSSRKVEMLALAMVAVRSADPIDHWILSWQDGEQPTARQIDEVVDMFAMEMGVVGHQIIYGLHSDTDNYHLHLALNRVSTATEKVVKINRGFDHEAALYAIEQIETRQGWDREAGAIHRERDEKGNIVRFGENVVQPGNRALQFESRTGARSTERISQEEAAPIIRDSKSWYELHRRLASAGIEYEQKGSGAVIKIGGLVVKASKSGRDCSLTSLTKRLGKFEPAQQKTVLDRAPEPVTTAHQDSWTSYIRERDLWRAQKAKDLSSMQLSHGCGRKQLAADYRQLQSRVLTQYGNWKGYGQILNVQRSVLASHQAGLRAELRDKQKRERAEFHSKMPRFPDFELWMRRQISVEQADDFRYRHDQARVVGPNFESPRPRDIRDYTAKICNGVVFYRAIGTSTVSFVDRGKHIDIGHPSDRDAVLAALQLSAQKWGTFHVFGNDQYKRLCIELAIQHGFKIANLELQAAIGQASAPSSVEPTVLPLAAGADSGEVYRKHYEHILARQNGHGPIDPSRVDSMIAVRMRVTGHEREVIVKTLTQQGPKSRAKIENRDWNKYAERTVSFAFGPGGERQRSQLKRYAAQWMKLEGMDSPSSSILDKNPARKPEPGVPSVSGDSRRHVIADNPTREDTQKALRRVQGNFGELTGQNQLADGKRITNERKAPSNGNRPTRDDLDRQLQKIAQAKTANPNAKIHAGEKISSPQITARVLGYTSGREEILVERQGGGLLRLQWGGKAPVAIGKQFDFDPRNGRIGRGRSI